MYNHSQLLQDIKSIQSAIDNYPAGSWNSLDDDEQYEKLWYPEQPFSMLFKRKEYLNSNIISNLFYTSWEMVTNISRNEPYEKITYIQLQQIYKIFEKFVKNQAFM